MYGASTQPHTATIHLKQTTVTAVVIATAVHCAPKIQRVRNMLAYADQIDETKFRVLEH